MIFIIRLQSSRVPDTGCRSDPRYADLLRRMGCRSDLGSLTFPLPPPNMSTQCPLRRNPLGKRFPITASSAKSAAAAWVSCTRRKT